MVCYLMYLPPTYSATYLFGYLLIYLLPIHLPINYLPTYLYFVTFVQPTYLFTHIRTYYIPMSHPLTYLNLAHSSDILSIRFKHTHIIHFFGLFKKYLKILDHRCLWVWAQLKLSLLNVLFIVFTYFTYSHFQILKYLKILLFEHLRKIRVFRKSLL